MRTTIKVASIVESLKQQRNLLKLLTLIEFKRPCLHGEHATKVN